MKKIDKNIILILVTSLLSMSVAIAQNQFQLPLRFGLDALDLNDVDTIVFGKENHKIVISSTPDDIQQITFKKSSLNLDGADVSTTGNVLKDVRLTDVSNPGFVYSTVEAIQSANKFSVFVPYLVNRDKLSLSYTSTGMVFCNQNLQKSGISKVDFTSSQTYKVVDASGNIASYEVNVYNSNIPVVFVTTSSEGLSTNWTEGNQMMISYPDGSLLYKDSNVQLKYKGSKYSKAVKRSLSVKLDKKSTLLKSEGKRYSIYANNDDASLLRTHIACDISSKFSNLVWTPSVQPVEVVIDNQHKGSFLLCEDARISEQRVNAKALLSWTEEYEADNNHFKSGKLGLIFELEDEDGMNAESAKEYIDAFESSLMKNNGLDKIDLNSFVDWYLLHEIFKAKSAAKSAFLSISSDGIISMGPIDSQEDALGNYNESVEDFVLRNHPWFSRLFENPDFVSLVCKRFNDLSSAIKGTSFSSLVEELNLSYGGDIELYNLNTGRSLSDEVSEIQKWLNDRIDWLSIRFENESKTAVKDQNGQNEILSFSVKKNANSEALLGDFSASIKGDSVKVFIPYLAHFDLKPEFSLSSGAKAYVNGEEQRSGSSIVNFLYPVTYKIVSSNGQVRTYHVSIYNSGINVLYINTPNGKKIDSKTVWIANTSVTAYRSDGTIDYESKLDSVKGRGNSTWDASQDKRPYALKLNKKHRIYGMLEHKRWVLMANYYDVTFFRNEFSNFLAKRYTGADWSPSGTFVELVLNGVHIGNYYLCEQCKIHENRVPGKYLVEADLKEGKGQIKGVRSGNYFNVKHPEVSDNSQECQYVKGILDNLENALYDGNWEKVKTLIDLNSFVDWYIVKELSKDYDGNMFTSCYCHIMEDGIVRMGPIWDFDLAWGGNPFETMFGSFGGGSDYAWYNQPEDYYIGAKNNTSSTGGFNWGGWGQQQQTSTGDTNWFIAFFKQKEFQSLVLDRVNYMMDHLDEIQAYIDEYTSKLALSASVKQSQYSDNKNMSYSERMNIIKKFFTDRLKWIQNDLRSR